MQKNHKVLIGLLAVTLIVLAAVTLLVLKKDKKEITTEAINTFSNAPGEEPYTDLVGNPVSLDKYLGNIMVVTTWASWSPFSANDLTMMQSLSIDYQDKGIVFLAINRKEPKEQASRYLMTVPEITDVIMVLDPRDHFYTVTGGYAMPELLVYDKTGKIILHNHGTMAEAELKIFLDDILLNEQ
jgi:hypothetical protein